MPNHPAQNLTIATTGASGAIFLRQFLLAVDRDQRVKTINFIASDSALRVMAEELGVNGRSNLVSRILGTSSSKAASRASSKIHDKIKEQSNADIGANVASGSYPADAMIVIPCSVGTLARISNGIAALSRRSVRWFCASAKRHSTKSTSETCTGPQMPEPPSFR